ncbi:MAG: DUF3795 domain-containing protein [Dehalococcoidia bacterium]
MNRKLKAQLIAPCGMNCGICMAYLRDKNRCPGCRGDDAHKMPSCLRCSIKNCETIAKSKSKFCFECEKHCARLKQLDKRYRTKYNMSMIENLEFIKNNGVDAFIAQQEAKYKCPQCGGVICVHRKKCFACNYIESSE